MPTIRKLLRRMTWPASTSMPSSWKFITLLTSDGNCMNRTIPRPSLVRMAPSRPRLKKLSSTPGGEPSLSDDFVQIQRMGNALINELLIGTGDKDKFSMSAPEDDAQFANYLLDPLLARVINAAYGGAAHSDATTARPRTARPLCTPDLSGLYHSGIAGTHRRLSPAEHRYSADIPGGPETPGRSGWRSRWLPERPPRVERCHRHFCGLSWVLAGPPFNGFPNNRLGDGVNTNDVPYQETFPYVAFANSGRNSQHQDPGLLAVSIQSLAPIDCPTD